MSNFDSNGKYNKTNWKTGDKITADKLNKIEESLETINDNDIIRHEETDARLDALETSMEDMTTEIEVELEGLHVKDNELIGKINNHIHNTIIVVNDNEALINAISNNTHDVIDLKKGTYSIDMPLTVKCKILGNGSTINVTSTITTSSQCKLYDINFSGSERQTDCLNLNGGPIVEGCTFSGFNSAIFQTGITVHGLIKRNTFQYNINGIYLQNSNSNSANNLTIVNNYFVKHGQNVDDLTADSTEPVFPSSVDTSAQGTGLDDIVGVGIICKSGCNGVFIHNNVFEYNSFCGVLVYQCNANKTNDVKITSNYFEGNKTSGIVLVNPASMGGVMQTNIHDNFYARIAGQNSDFYSYDLKCLGSANTTLNLINGWGHRPLWHPFDVATAGVNVVRDDIREYYDLIVGTSKQYFQIPMEPYHQVDNVSYQPVPFIFEYKVKLNKPLTFCDGTKTTNAIIKSFEAGEHFGMEIVPVVINYSQYLTRALESDEYFRIYRLYPLTKLL